jgi:hypothetical protein
VSLGKAVGPGWAGRLFGGRPGATLALLRAAWPRVVGPDVARRTEVLAVDGVTLRVRVADARWRKVLHRMQREILGRLREAAGDLAPKRLGFTEGPVHEQVDAAPPPETRPAPEPTAPPAVVAGAQAIADPEIRRRFLETAARYLTRAGAPR